MGKKPFKNQSPHHFSSEEETLIPYETIPLEDSTFDGDIFIHTPHCLKDDLTIFFRATKEPGFSDPEPLHCPFCRFPLYRGANTDNIIGSTITPKVIACLKLEKNKTLSLVFTEFCSETEKVALQNHILKLDFTTFANQVELRQSDRLFPKNSNARMTNNYFSKSSLLSCIKLNKRSGKGSGFTGSGKRKKKDAFTNQGNKKSKASKAFLERMRQAYEKSQKTYLKLQSSSKPISLKRRQSLFLITKNELKPLKRNAKLFSEMVKSLDKSKVSFQPLSEDQTRNMKTGMTTRLNKD